MCILLLQSFLDGAHISKRCDTAAQLMLNGCEEEFIENPGVKVEVNMTLSSSQVTPRDISIQLRPGKENQSVYTCWCVTLLYHRVSLLLKIV